MDAKEKLSRFIDDGGRLTNMPSKRKMRIYALIYFASKFESNKKYTEKEVNEVINGFTQFNDPATIRRDLFNYHFLNRETDGSSYWLEETQPTLEQLGVEE